MGASSAPGVSPSQVWSKACCDESGADGGAGTMSSSGGTSGRSSSPLLYTAYVQRNLSAHVHEHRVDGGLTMSIACMRSAMVLNAYGGYPMAVRGPLPGE